MLLSLGLFNKNTPFTQSGVFSWVFASVKRSSVLFPKLCAADDLSINWNNQNQIEFIDGANDVFDDMSDDIFTNYLLKNQSQSIHINPHQNHLNSQSVSDYSHFNLSMNGYQPVFNDFGKNNVNGGFPSSLSSNDTVSPLDDEYYKKPFEDTKKRSLSDDEYLTTTNSDISYKKIKLEEYQFDFNGSDSNLSLQLASQKIDNSVEQSRYESEFNDKFNDKFKFEPSKFTKGSKTFPGLDEFHLDNQLIKVPSSQESVRHDGHSHYLPSMEYPSKLDTIDMTVSGPGSRGRKKSRTSSTGSDSSFDCPHCDATFKVKGYLTRHLKKHSSSKAFVCPFYQEQGVLGTKCHPTGGFSRRDTFKTHLKALHFIYPPGTKSNERNNIGGRCAGCFEFFENNFQWLIHHIEAKQCTGTVNAKKQDLTE